MADPRNYAAQAGASTEQTESQAIMSRLHSIRGMLGDARGSAVSIADKLVGAEPAKLTGGATQGIAEPPAASFLHGLSRMCDELNGVARDISDQLERLHRSF